MQFYKNLYRHVRVAVKLWWKFKSKKVWMGRENWDNVSS